MSNIELLSPVGRKESAYAAIENGADAIYLGGKKFGARAFADNFDVDDLKVIIQYAHLRNVKVYVTMNTLMFEDELEECKAYIKQLYDIQVDALIVQDLGILYYLRRTYPDFEVHASTQMHIYNKDALSFLVSQGVKRAVLARECSIEKIESFKDIPIEKEVFVHGALCVSYSGQCLFSSINHNRSGNRGACAQGCRMKYDLSVEEELIKEDVYLLSPKDLNSLDNMEQLLQAGITSFKIEGRMKSNEYVAFTTHMYRYKIDHPQYKITQEELETMKVIFHRSFSEGHAFHALGSSLINEERPNHIGVEIGYVKKYENGKVYILLNKPLAQFDAIRFLGIDDGCIINFLYKDELLVSKADASDMVAIDFKKRVPIGSKVVKTKDIEVEKKVQESYRENTKKIALTAKVTLRIGQPMQLEIKDQGIHISMDGEQLVQAAQKRPVETEDIINGLRKTGNTPYIFSAIDVVKDDSIFIPLKEINEVRRNAIDAYEKQKLQSFKREMIPFLLEHQKHKKLPPRISVHVQNKEQIEACLTFEEITIFTDDYKLYKEYKKHTQVCFSSENIYDEAYDDTTQISELGGLNKGKDINASVPIQNSLALQYVTDLDNQYVTLGLEMHQKNIEDMMNAYTQKGYTTDNIEYMVYGKVKLMSMEYCPVNYALLDNDKHNCQLCKQRNYYLKNKQRQSFFLKGDAQCHMHMYSDTPRNEIAHIPYYKSIGIKSFSLHFVDEHKEMVIQRIKEVLYA